MPQFNGKQGGAVPPVPAQPALPPQRSADESPDSLSIHKPLGALNKRLGRHWGGVPPARIPANTVAACALFWRCAAVSPTCWREAGPGCLLTLIPMKIRTLRARPVASLRLPAPRLALLSLLAGSACAAFAQTAPATGELLAQNPVSYTHLTLPTKA